MSVCSTGISISESNEHVNQVSRWDEVFEPIFVEAGFAFEDVHQIQVRQHIFLLYWSYALSVEDLIIFKRLQRACVCWSNQELSRFDEPAGECFDLQYHYF